MPRPLAEQVLSLAIVEGAKTDKTRQGLVVCRVTYRLEVQTAQPLPGSLLPGCYRIMVEYETHNPVQAIHSVSAVPIPDPTPTHTESTHPE